MSTNISNFLLKYDNKMPNSLLKVVLNYLSLVAGGACCKTFADNDITYCYLRGHMASRAIAVLARKP